MSCRNRFWTVTLVFFGCAPFFHHENDFERGLESYKNKEYAAAVDYFKSYHTQHPDYDSALYYLFNCYQKLNKPEEQIPILEKLVHGNMTDENVYLNLVYYYRKYERYKDLYILLSHYPRDQKDNLERHLALTRRLFAELICGATTQKVTTDPMIYSISKGYLPRFPDGQLYAEDTLTYANLIVLLDRLVEPDYPRNFFPMKNLSAKSYLYLPYMRLVDSGILTFEPYLVPEFPARISTTVNAVEVLSKRGRLD
jgi:tetratricopeptide (TPR) repeat protein